MAEGQYSKRIQSRSYCLIKPFVTSSYRTSNIPRLIAVVTAWVRSTA